MSPVDIIRRTRDGEALTTEEIQALVRGASDGSMPDYQVAAWLMAVRLRGLSDRETSDLTLAMAASGRTLDLSSIPGRKVDKHSTGGVGDKATLVVGPLVAACGIPVAKLSGRALGHSGGTLDKLESIPGFRVDLSVAEFIAQVQRIGIAVTGQTADMVPADKVFYALRDTTATVDSVPLIASSVMSKKLAAGADAIVLDVKAGRGAFVPTVEAGEELARALVAIGAGAGRETVAYVTDMEQPLGCAVGNALEVREAIDTLMDAGPADLRMLSLRLGAEMVALARGGDRHAVEAELAQALRDGRAQAKFAELVGAQSGRAWHGPRQLPLAGVQAEVRAPSAGWVRSIDALAIGMASKRLGAGRDHKDDPIDYSVGIVLRAKVGDQVVAGTPLAVIHARSDADARSITETVTSAFRIGDRVGARPLFLRRVTSAGVERLA